VATVFEDPARIATGRALVLTKSPNESSVVTPRAPESPFAG
jgi:hypothetical protein